MAISIYSESFILNLLMPSMIAILSGIFIILTYHFKKDEIEYSRFFILAGSLLILSRIALIIMYIFDINFFQQDTSQAKAAQFLIYALVQHIPILITFLLCFSIIGIYNQNKLGNSLLIASIFGTIYSVLLLVFDMAIYYWILGYVPIYIALSVSFVALILFVITCLLMIFIGFKFIHKYFALAGVCFLLEDFIFAFIWFLFI